MPHCRKPKITINLTSYLRMNKKYCNCRFILNKMNNNKAHIEILKCKKKYIQSRKHRINKIVIHSLSKLFMWREFFKNNKSKFKIKIFQFSNNKYK